MPAMGIYLEFSSSLWEVFLWWIYYVYMHTAILIFLIIFLYRRQERKAKHDEIRRKYGKWVLVARA